MTDILLHPRSVERSTSDLRLSAIRRRINLSPSLAAVVAGHLYGARERDDVTTLQTASAARVAAYAEVRA